MSKYLFPKGHKINNGRKASLATRKLMSSQRQRHKHPMWNGGIKHTSGYICIYSPDHPNCTKQGYVLEHRIVMEKHIGRYLKRSEQIHHKNEVKDDNRICNLVLCKNLSEHKKLHYPDNTNKHRKCSGCKKILSLNHNNFNKNITSTYGYEYYCKICKNKLNKKYKENK